MEAAKDERGEGEGSQEEEGDNFRSVYKQVVKNKSANGKTNRNNAFAEMLEVSRITDYNVVMKYEYLLKLSFFSSNVNVLNVYRLVKQESEKQFGEVAARLRSNMLLSIMDTNKINDKSEHVGEYFTKNYEELKQLEFVIGNTDYPLGFEKNTNGVFRVYLFKIIPSKTLLLNKSNLSFMEKGKMPSNYDSVAVDRNLYYEQVGEGQSELVRSGSGGGSGGGSGPMKGTSANLGRGGTNYSYIYKVKAAEQVLPLLLIEFEFKCLRVDISVPICEYCYTAKAIYYCHNDKVHLCNICDIKHHEKNKILKNHRRMPISESPYQFGKCAYHPNEVVESVCMKCYCSLCPTCLLIGSHSKGNYRNHPIVNIKDAFILSNQKKSLSDINLENRKSRILLLLKKKHKLLAEIYSNYTSLQKRIDTLYRYIIDELKVLKKKKMQYIMALKRAVLSQLLTIEWTEAFFYHTKLSLNLSDFILYQKKHQLAVQFLIAKKGKDSDFMKNAPHWLFQKIYVQSNLCIYEDSFFKLNFVSPKDLDEGMAKGDLNRKRCVLKGSRNKLEEMYNFNNVFNDKKGYLGLYDETAFEGGANSEEGAHQTSVKYSAAKGAEDEQSPREATHEGFSNQIEPVNTSGLNNKDLQSVLKLKKEYASMYDVTEEKPTNCNLLSEIFRDEREGNSCGGGKTPLKQSHICRELWKHLVNYKYINVIHVLKARCSLNTLLLTHSFFNVASYYDNLEDLVKHIIKHEIFTLLNKNIDYHTKMKVTHVLDSVATLLCLRRFVLAPWVDKYIELCCSHVGSEQGGGSSPGEEAPPNGEATPGEEATPSEDIIREKNSDVRDEHAPSVRAPNEQVKGINLTSKSAPGEVAKGDKNSCGELRVGREKEEFPTNGGNDTTMGDQTVLEEDNTISEDMDTKKDEHHVRSTNKHYNMAGALLTAGEKQELSSLKKIKEHIYVYLEMLINDLVKIPHKDLNDGVRFMFYLIHDEIDGKNKNLVMNEKKFSIHTLCLCLDIFLNSVLYPYIFYVHEENLNGQVKTSMWKDPSLHQKVVVLFGQTVREISIYVFQVYNLGMYDSNLKAFISNIKDNKMLRGRATNEKMFFLDVSQKLFQWIVKNLESPRYYAPVRWNSREGVEKSYQRIVQEIVHIDESSTNNCVNENVDYNILFSTKNFKEILSLCYSMQGVGA
ncbi:hypothetical protein, conserved [Plasmodium vivax]|uniref:B box-type domain-containing protein n=2 Tax=Plasmodium vivax TaxID=5855 RepID=A5K406_PLAVS|nr:hypothetical protein, conserved [Plasmodium vivax]EDL46260.1 hypothetical protein, conserved [Plasmodium vivax]KMZ87167.1 hypothetical protein PVBG_03952 [Plasmodium vivax Brazil I]|eukprot:XP_001615987.1 hypothetical protein [Plasmodium vivax Sal-1]